MRTPPVQGGARQDGTDTGVIDLPHNCPFPADLSSPKTEHSPHSRGEMGAVKSRPNHHGRGMLNAELRQAG